MDCPRYSGGLGVGGKRYLFIKLEDKWSHTILVKFFNVFAKADETREGGQQNGGLVAQWEAP
jgi:hypothetical protein